MRPGNLLFMALATLIVGLGACANDAKDSHCEPGGGDDRCISDPDGSGPAVKEPLCAAPSAADALPEGTSCDDWGFDRVEGFLTSAEGNCSATGCHGSEGTAAIGIYFPFEDRCLLYQVLSAQRGSVGRPYLKADDLTTEPNEALESWMYCNVLGLPGGGYPMPKPGGVHDPASADAVRNFILCGAQAPDGCDLGGGT